MCYLADSSKHDKERGGEGKENRKTLNDSTSKIHKLVLVFVSLKQSGEKVGSKLDLEKLYLCTIINLSKE